MKSVPGEPIRLAPLQRAMLADSLSNPGTGVHVEQVDIIFAPGIPDERVMAAWEATVKSVEALQFAFHVSGTDWGLAAGEIPIISQGKSLHASFSAWLETDRKEPFLGDHVPWRVTWWPDARRFIWTFHHALLDGRSIARVLDAFLGRINGGDGKLLRLSKWREPSATVIREAESVFRESYVPGSTYSMIPGYGIAGSASCALGADFASRLARQAADLGVTVASMLAWCWGQARAELSGLPATWVEQVRAGAPQDGTAGFTMNTLPVAIHRAAVDDSVHGLCALRERLLALRRIEAVSAEDFPSGFYPDLCGPEVSVMMVEHATLSSALGPAMVCVESLVLHEPETESLTALAHIAPDFHLQVEGPGRQEHLAAWVAALEHVSNWQRRTFPLPVPV